MSNPNFVILFVDNPVASGEFYAGLFGCKPVEASPTFALFALDSGLKLGLWSRHAAEPVPTGTGGGGEIAFTRGAEADVDATHAAWKARGLKIIQEPTMMDFGYTFVAVDPDGHRLRVFTPAKVA